MHIEKRHIWRRDVPREEIHTEGEQIRRRYIHKVVINQNRGFINNENNKKGIYIKKVDL